MSAMLTIQCQDMLKLLDPTGITRITDFSAFLKDTMKKIRLFNLLLQKIDLTCTPFQTEQEMYPILIDKGFLTEAECPLFFTGTMSRIQQLEKLQLIMKVVLYIQNSKHEVTDITPEVNNLVQKLTEWKTHKIRLVPKHMWQEFVKQPRVDPAVVSEADLENLKQELNLLRTKEITTNEKCNDLEDIFEEHTEIEKSFDKIRKYLENTVSVTRTENSGMQLDNQLSIISDGLNSIFQDIEKYSAIAKRFQN